jgi:cellulose synthase/poly-beta-1,6-N-acetylglucosamine synthase-like glycosyltransferase
MKLSFSIPAHNEEEHIWRCLDSIFRQLEGKNYQAEVVVVDNASTDRTAEIARSYGGVKVVSEPKKGLLYARERGYLSSTGDLLANIDADTVLPPDWIQTVMSEFGKDQNLVALSGPYIYYDLSWTTQQLTKIFYGVGLIFHYLSLIFSGRGTLLQGGNFVLRRSALEQIGGFDTNISFYGEDTDIARRISQVGKVKFTFRLKMLTSGRRLSEEGIFTTGLRYAINHFWILIFHRPFTKQYGDVRRSNKSS